MNLTIRDDTGQTGEITPLSFEESLEYNAIVIRCSGSSSTVYFSASQLRAFSLWLTETADKMDPVQPHTFVGNDPVTI